jgi:hypothetical protein
MEMQVKKMSGELLVLKYFHPRLRGATKPSGFNLGLGSTFMSDPHQAFLETKILDPERHT